MKKHFLLMTLAALVAVGCNGGDSSGGAATSTGSPSASGGKAVRVGLVFDSGGVGDKSFNDSADAGLKRAQSELGVEGKSINSRDAKDYETNLTAMAEQGFDLVVAVGSVQANALKVVAPKFPDVKFAIVDADIDQPNVCSLLFSEEQGSFLAGYLAGLMTKTNKIGFVGGMKIALIEKFEAGYGAGAKTANPNVEFLPAKYTASWVDVGLGKAAAQTLYAQGADIVYHASGRCGLGVIDAARESGKFAIGVDGDQDGEAKGNVLTSMVKRVDNAVFETIKDVKDGKFTGGKKSFDLAQGGVGLTEFAYTKDKIGAENLKKLEEITKRVAANEIKVPTNRAELTTFQPK
ncbi:MAG: BMP family lipoprotein [Fimbriimonas sp.]